MTRSARLLGARGWFVSLVRERLLFMPPLCVDLGQDTGRWAFPPIPSDAGPVTDGMGGKESLTDLSGDAEAGCLKADAWVVVLCRHTA